MAWRCQALAVFGDFSNRLQNLRSAKPEFDGAIDMPAAIAATYVQGEFYTLEVKVGGETRHVRARPYYRRQLRNGKVRVFFRTAGRELMLPVK